MATHERSGLGMSKMDNLLPGFFYRILNHPVNCPDTNMAAGNCHAKFNCSLLQLQLPPIWVNDR